MGIVSLTTINRLFWVGRYSERVYTTLAYLNKCYDDMLDGTPMDYQDFCVKLGVPCSYQSVDEFFRNYIFDGQDFHSLRFAVDEMLGNGMVLRETLQSRTLAYLQMAVYAMDMAAKSDSPAIQFQWVFDDIMAFRGCYDEIIEDDHVRNMIKCGTSVERVSLYLRLGINEDRLVREVNNLVKRLRRSHLQADESAKEQLHAMNELLQQGKLAEVDKQALLHAVETLITF